MRKRSGGKFVAEGERPFEGTVELRSGSACARVVGYPDEAGRESDALA
jgi:hypothetical protein